MHTAIKCAILKHKCTLSYMGVNIKRVIIMIITITGMNSTWVYTRVTTCTSKKSVNPFIMSQIEDTFQVVISTDGHLSFAAFIYTHPLLIFSAIDLDPNTRSPIIGFDFGDRSKHADVGENLLLNNQTLEAVNIFRIDGKLMSMMRRGSCRF